MEKGEIWWASLPVPEGSDPGYRRPVVIVQADAFNRSRIRTVVVAAVTSNLRLAAAPGNVLLTRRESRLSKKSVVNVSQLLTLDKSFLVERVARLRAEPLAAIDDGLRLVLAL
ncbi:MAG: type II toxin-antitoxin system PemK/MazF family toxin [Candidatus Krumholzibacteriia bacterium]